MANYTAAVIGCGNIGAGVERYADAIQPWTHAGALKENPSVTLIGLVDTDAEKRTKAEGNFPGVPTYENVDAMFAVGVPDIVAIAVPTAYHAATLKQVVERGVKAIICEKPIAANIGEAEDMIRVCHARGVLLFINHIRRFDPLIREAKASLKQIGEVRQASARYTRGIHNNGTHSIDLLRFFLGEIVSVSGTRNTASESFSDLPGDQNIDGTLFFASGARASLQSYDNRDYSIFDFDFFARKGFIGLRHSGFHVERFGVMESPTFMGHRELDDQSRETKGSARSFMVPMVQHVVDCLEGNDTSVSTGEDGVAALKVIIALEESARQEGVCIVIKE